MARPASIAAHILLSALALLIGALDVLLVPDSLIFPWNRTLALGLAVLATLAGSLALRVRWRGIAALFLLACVGALWQIASPWMDRRTVLAQSGPQAFDLERHFVVGYTDIDSIRQLIREAHIGGVFLTQRNVAGRMPAEVAAEIAQLQGLRRASGAPPLVVAADQEGGVVSHMSPPLPLPPALSTLTSLPAEQRAPEARRVGYETGTGLRRLGVTMDLAPVCDLMPSGATALLDLHTRLKTRAISADPGLTARITAAFAAGLIDAGVTPTAKHFPGLARVPADTHLEGASLDAQPGELEASDWVPFRAVAALPGAAVMLAHVALKARDAGVPVSRSRAVVEGLLRQQWHFDGITITDDLTMGAVEHAGLCRAVEGALNAGVDLLLVSWDVDKAYPAMRCAVDALNAGRLDRAMLRQSAQRLDRLAARSAAVPEP